MKSPSNIGMMSRITLFSIRNVWVRFSKFVCSVTV